MIDQMFSENLSVAWGAATPVGGLLLWKHGKRYGESRTAKPEMRAHTNA